MSRIVFVVGTSHRIQFGLDKHEKFCARLVETCRHNGIQVVAEEAEAEFLKDYHVEQTVPFRAAKLLGLHHLYCDPSTETRAKLGVVERNALLQKKFMDAAPGNEAPILLDALTASNLSDPIASVRPIGSTDCWHLASGPCCSCVAPSTRGRCALPCTNGT